MDEVCLDAFLQQFIWGKRTFSGTGALGLLNAGPEAYHPAGPA
jgi:hypothetical protein